MHRPIDVLMIGLLIAGAAFTYKVKQDSEQAIERVNELEQAIKAERDAIDVLLADWSLLTDPKRIAKLVERYREQLDIAPAAPENIGSLSDIPKRPPSISEPPATGIAELIGREKVDETRTGTIGNQVGRQ